MIPTHPLLAAPLAHPKTLEWMTAPTAFELDRPDFRMCVLDLAGSNALAATQLVKTALYRLTGADKYAVLASRPLIDELEAADAPHRDREELEALLVEIETAPAVVMVDGTPCAVIFNTEPDNESVDELPPKAPPVTVRGTPEEVNAVATHNRARTMAANEVHGRDARAAAFRQAHAALVDEAHALTLTAPDVVPANLATVRQGPRANRGATRTCGTRRRTAVKRAHGPPGRSSSSGDDSPPKRRPRRRLLARLLRALARLLPTGGGA